MDDTTQLKEKFYDSMTIKEAQKLDPRVSQVLAYFHIGGCHHCQVDENITLEQACRDFGVPKDLLLRALNSLR